MPKVKVYSTSWCTFCKKEKQYLDEKGVDYEDINVEADPKAAQEMVNISGQMGVPFTVIIRDDNTQVGILGFNQPQLAKELGLS